jgi:hypothetical protein
MPAAFRYLIAFLFMLPVLAHAQTLDTLTTEQLLDRKGSAYQRERAQLRPSHYLVFDVNHTLGGFRRYRFFEGDDIHFKARGEKYHEEVYQITDSTFSVVGGFVLSGAIFHWISNPTIRANKNHKLRVLQTY